MGDRTAKRTPRIAGLMMVRNEQHLVASCIGHMLNTLGVDKIYVVDNGSVDRTPAILRQIAEETGRVVVEHDAGDYRQGPIISDLARRAAQEGADWVLPCDADEFLWLRPGTTLASLCEREDIGGYTVSLCNFMQARPMRKAWIGSLTTMAVSAIPFGSVGDGLPGVTSGKIPFVRITYPTKVMVRTTPDLTFAFGYHSATGLAGPLVPLQVGELLHAPITSYDNLRRRIETGRRVQVVTPEPGQNWHHKRMVAMNQAELDAEWRHNSYSPLRPVVVGARRLDFRLARVGLAQLRFASAHGG